MKVEDVEECLFFGCHGECQVVAGANPPEAVLKKAPISGHSRVKFETGNKKARRSPMF
jgi:hypothetical protein